MAFFGLTALGPQNTFSAAAKNYRYIQVFSDADFESAWRRVSHESDHCHKTKIPDILKVLFHGPVPDNEKPFIDAAFDGEFETPETISFDSYMRILRNLRSEAQKESTKIDNDINPVCEYNSTCELQLAMKKNAAMKTEIQQKITKPITGTQEVSLLANPSTFAFKAVKTR